jgi:hypothetical protein
MSDDESCCINNFVATEAGVWCERCGSYLAVNEEIYH